MNTDKEDEQMEALLRPYAAEVLDHPNFRRTKDFIQHSNVSVYHHVLHVACCALEIDRRLHLGCDRCQLVRAALLHDYFLYDWHEHDAPGNKHPRLHGFYHPGIAARNAKKDFNLTERELDAIRKHMWPLTVIPPKTPEGYVVMYADKYCSLRETCKNYKKMIPEIRL